MGIVIPCTTELKSVVSGNAWEPEHYSDPQGA
jgi:hypothetical protein